MELSVVPTQWDGWMDGWMVDVTQNLTIFAPNLASEWIAGQFQHVEAKIWPNLAVANFNYFSFLFLLYSLGSKLELREILRVGRLLIIC